MRNLLLFTIGPVQSFISQARKTQEWQGMCFIEMVDFDRIKMNNWLLNNIENG